MKPARPKPVKVDPLFTPRLLHLSRPPKLALLPEIHSSMPSKDSSNRSVPTLPKLDRSRLSAGEPPQSLSSRSFQPDKSPPSESRPVSSVRSGVLSPRFMANVLQRTNDAIRCSDSSIEVLEDTSKQLDFSRTYHLADLESGCSGSSRGIISFANVSRKRGTRRVRLKTKQELTHRLAKAQGQIKDLQITSEDMRRRMEFHRERIKVLEEYCLGLNARFKGEVERLKKSCVQVEGGRHVLVKEATTSTLEVPMQASHCCLLM